MNAIDVVTSEEAKVLVRLRLAAEEAGARRLAQVGSVPFGAIKLIHAAMSSCDVAIQPALEGASGNVELGAAAEAVSDALTEFGWCDEDGFGSSVFHATSRRLTWILAARGALVGDASSAVTPEEALERLLWDVELDLGNVRDGDCPEKYQKTAQAACAWLRRHGVTVSERPARPNGGGADGTRPAASPAEAHEPSLRGLWARLLAWWRG